MFMIHDGNELMAISFKMPEAITKHYKHPDVTQKNIHKMGSNIRHIKTPSKEFQMLAVKQDGFAIQYLINPSKELCVEALYQNPKTIPFMNIEKWPELYGLYVLLTQ